MNEHRPVGAPLQGVGRRFTGKTWNHSHRDVEAGEDQRERSCERFGRYSNHREVEAVQKDGFADHVGTGGKLGLPQVVAQHDHGIAARHAVLLGAEIASGGGRHAKDAKEVAAHHRAEFHPRQGILVDRETEREVLRRHQSAERLVATAQVDKIRVRHR